MVKVGNNSIAELSQVKVGGGIITKNDNSVTLTTSAPTDKAYICKFIPCRAGERVVVRVTARCLENAISGKEMKVAIDTYQQALVAQVPIKSRNWETYTISAVVPYNKNGIVFFKAVAGAWSNQINKVEIAEFDVFVESNGFVVARAHAMCVVNLTPASVALNTQHLSIGINNIQYSSGELLITTNSLLNVNTDSTSPIQTIQLQASIKCPVNAYIADYNRNTGVVKIKFADFLTGENVDIRQSPYTDGGNIFKLHFSSLF